MTKGLWVARALPFPFDTGDRIYSAMLIKAVADAGADLTVAGFAPTAAAPADWPVEWRIVPGGPHGVLRSVASTLPQVAAAHGTSPYRRAIADLARQAWDFVVFDHYGTGWAIPAFARNRAAGGRRTVLVHVAHDHEATLYASLVRGFRGSQLKRLALWQNWLKTGWLERRMARSVDLVSCITKDDAARFAADAPNTAHVVLTPGYSGETSSRTRIGPDTPRNVLIVGNYKWIAKSENLRQFVAAADAAFHAHGITLHVVGSISDELARDLRANTRATVIHGFVADIAPHLASARIAVVPEVIGGGFKLKFLDYIFGRVAVASLTHATAGLPQEIREAMICRDDLPALVQGIIDGIGDTEALTRMQETALEAAKARYNWADRGRDLLAAVAQRAAGSSQAPG